MKKATKEEIEKWREEDFWNKMDFNPAWIFILPTLLAVSYTHLTLPTSDLV